MPNPIWTLLHPRATAEHLGLIPQMLNLADPRPAREQFNSNYAYGGGWAAMTGWVYDPADQTIKLPFTRALGGDPALRPIASTTLRDEQILLYPYAWVAIVQPDGRAEVARMD